MIPTLAVSLKGAPEDTDEAPTIRLEMVIAALVEQRATGQIGYWAEFTDPNGVSHCAFTKDPGYAEVSADNAARRAEAVAGFDRAIERYRSTLTGFRSRS
jgi:hypothetical protein